MKQRTLKRMWRICTNPRSNDWNNEPEHLAVPYEILEEKKKSHVCMRAGWHQKNVLAKREFYKTKAECTAAIIEKYAFKKKYTDNQLEELWSILGAVPVNDNDETVERFIDFPPGTLKEKIWHWFDERHSKGVYALMYTEKMDMEHDNSSRESEFEYAAFAWNADKQEYEQIGRPVMNEKLCRERFKECVEKGWLMKCYDTGKVIFKKRTVSVVRTGWEEMKED